MFVFLWRVNVGERALVFDGDFEHLRCVRANNRFCTLGSIRAIQFGEELWKWFQEGAAFYICGDASRMAKDVDAALHTVAEVHGKMSKEEAVAFIAQLKKDKRYLRDVY